jgi:hypothetical protein
MSSPPPRTQRGEWRDRYKNDLRTNAVVSANAYQDSSFESTEFCRSGDWFMLFVFMFQEEMPVCLLSINYMISNQHHTYQHHIYVISTSNIIHITVVRYYMYIVSVRDI